MTRDEALLKLLRVEPETKDRIIRCTGWPTEETLSVLDKLVADGRVTWANGAQGAPGRRVYFPKAQPA